MSDLLPDHQRFNLGYLGLETAQLYPGRIAVIDRAGKTERRFTARPGGPR